jgi:hypothetical protein
MKRATDWYLLWHVSENEICNSSIYVLLDCWSEWKPSTGSEMKKLEKYQVSAMKSEYWSHINVECEMRVTVSGIKCSIKKCNAKQVCLLSEYYLQFKTYVNLFYKIHATQMMLMMTSNILQEHKIKELQKKQPNLALHTYFWKYYCKTTRHTACAKKHYM